MTVDAGDGSALFFLDLSAAFDTVDHEILLERLSNHCGVTDTAASWFRSYLTGRTQVFCINGELSESSALLTGVPQGAVAYLIFANPLPSVFGVTTFVMALVLVNFPMTLDATSSSAFFSVQLRRRYPVTRFRYFSRLPTTGSPATG